MHIIYVRTLFNEAIYLPLLPFNSFWLCNDLVIHKVINTLVQ